MRTLKVTDETHEHIAQIAASEDRSMSMIVARAIRLYEAQAHRAPGDRMPSAEMAMAPVERKYDAKVAREVRTDFKGR